MPSRDREQAIRPGKYVADYICYELGGARSTTSSNTSDRPSSPLPTNTTAPTPTTSGRKSGTQQQLYSVTAQASLGKISI
jgi:hypothetical protein